MTAVAYAVGDIGNTDICKDKSKDTTTIIDGYLLLEKDFLKPIPDYDGYDYANTQCFADGAGAAPDGIPAGTDPQDSAGPCDIITYQIKYTNIGDQDAVNVQISDSIPDHTTYVLGSLHVDSNCDYATGGDITPTDAAGDDRHCLEMGTARGNPYHPLRSCHAVFLQYQGTELLLEHMHSDITDHHTRVSLHSKLVLEKT
jgi:uncharacterized repeat protein (TIGR01451 family)